MHLPGIDAQADSSNVAVSVSRRINISTVASAHLSSYRNVSTFFQQSDFL